MPIATPTSLSLQPPTTAEPAFYQSYSCDDLYLASDLTPGRNFSSSSEPIAEQQCETPTPAEENGRGQQPDQETADANELVFERINLNNPAATETVCVHDSQSAVDGYRLTSARAMKCAIYTRDALKLS